MPSMVSVAFPRSIHLSGWLLIWRLMERVGIENCFWLMLLWRKTAVAVQTALRMVLCAFLVRCVLLSEVLAAWAWPLLALGIHCRNIWCCRVLSAAVFACLASNQRSQCVSAWCAMALLAPLFPPRSAPRDLTCFDTKADVVKWIEANGRKWRDRLRDCPYAVLEQWSAVLGVSESHTQRRRTKETLWEAVFACVCVFVSVGERE